jgi:hypothetical protein
MSCADCPGDPASTILTRLLAMCEGLNAQGAVLGPNVTIRQAHGALSDVEGQFGRFQQFRRVTCVSW